MIYKSELRDFSRIPDAMKQVKRWVCWNETKKPVNPVTLYGAQSNNPETWGTFKQAEAQIGKPCSVANVPGTVQGVGFMLGDGWTGIDLDGGKEHGCGEIPQSVIDDFSALGTYTEHSKSGGGYHIIGIYQGEPLQGSSFTWNDGTPDKYGVEMYFSGRYFAITGNIYGYSSEILDITEGLPALHEKYIAEPNRKKAQQAASPSRSTVTAPTGEQNEFLRANIYSLLAAIDPDSPREVWWRIGAALKAEGFDVSVFDEWSARGSKYKGHREIASVWNSLRRGGVNGGYIVKEAQSNGWRPETVTDSYKPKTAAQDFSGITVHTAQPATAEPAPDAQPATAQPVQAAPAPVKAPENALSALKRFKATTGSLEYRPIATGFPGIDTMLNGGFDPGTMTIVVAEPGTGKTALVMQIAENMAKNAQPVMVFNLEMSEEQLIARSLSRLTAEIVGTVVNPALNPPYNIVDPGDLGAAKGKEALYSNGWFTLDEKKRRNLSEALERFEKYGENLYLVTDPITQYEQIIEAVTAFKAATGKTPVVIVDYLQLLFSDGKTSAVYSAKDIILGLKQRIARQMQTAVIMISATGRDKAKKGKMDLQSAFGSSFIEYSADYQFGLEKVDPEEYVYKTFEKPLVLSLVKGRMEVPHSRQGLFFAGAYSLCREIDITELRTVEKLVAKKRKEEEKRQKEEDSQGDEPGAQPAIIKGKLT